LILTNLERLAEEWALSDPINLSNLGRTAVKLQNVEHLYSKLHAQAHGILASLNPYTKPASLFEGHEFPGYSTRDPGTYPVGRVKGATVEAAKDIEPNKLTFKEVPGFDPVPLYDDDLARAYIEPKSEHLPGPHPPAPRVRLRASREVLLSFFRKLDDGRRLRLFPAGTGDAADANGGFGIAKDTARDRFVMDARPSNRKHAGRCWWTRLMASASSLLGLRIPWGEVAAMSGDDLQDFYYDFKISEGRAVKNIFVGKWLTSLFSGFQCYRPELARHKYVVLALDTLAQGDLDAVEFGQAAHIALMARSGILRQDELISMRGRFPRTAYAAGIVIDDHCAVELEPAGIIDSAGRHQPSKADPAGVAAERFAAAGLVYSKAGLHRHSGKAFRREHRATLWGGQLDGCSGWLSAPLPRVAALVHLTLFVAKSGFATAGLLYMLAGSWVSVFLFRRRLLALMDLIFLSYRGRSPNDILHLSHDLRSELIFLCLFAPAAKSDLRADACPWLSLVDASNWGIAHVRSDVPAVAARELQRHLVVKGLWNRMLGRASAWLRTHDLLGDSDQLPGGEAHVHSPLWNQVVQFLAFTEVSRRAYGRRPHINEGEISASLESEASDGRLATGARTATGTDSQVALGCLTKGRSSSPRLNAVLQTGIPNLLGKNLYPGYFWTPSSLNASDDPTRGLPVRSPVLDIPEWWTMMASGDFDALDYFFDTELPGSRAYSAEQVSQPRLSDCLLPSLHAPAPLRRESERRSHLDVKGMPEASTSATAAPLPQGLGLSRLAVELLSHFPRSRFMLSPADRRDASWTPSSRGALDLFAGSRGYARALLQKGCPWVLTFDFAHGPGHDLLDPDTRSIVEALIEAGAFATVAAGPVCSSLSTAVFPAVRTSLRPKGMRSIRPAMREKVRAGNEHGEWCSRIFAQCLRLSILIWVENPASSFLWRFRSWRRLLDYAQVDDFITDQCRWAAPFRKRTRFRTNIPGLAGERITCLGGHQHIILRGSAPGGVQWTKAAEPYPRGLCHALAAAVAISIGWELRRLDLAACARCGHRRIGEAGHP